MLQIEDIRDNIQILNPQAEGGLLGIYGAH